MRTTIEQRTRGQAEKAGGRIRRFFGRLFKSERLEAKGRGEELRGEARERAAKAGERVQGAVEEMGGAAERTAGEVIGSPRLESEGDLKETEGEVRRDLNR
jgi:uncharacterized protein YjbJ (UPF0337 family)